VPCSSCTRWPTRTWFRRCANARLPQRYFECILQSLQNAFIYDRLIISWANELPQPELAAEVVIT